MRAGVGPSAAGTPPLHRLPAEPLGCCLAPEPRCACCGPALQVSAVWAYQARYRVPLSKAVAGDWVLLEGVDATSECNIVVVVMQVG